METSDLIKQVDEAGTGDVSAWRFLEMAGYVTSAANLPLALAMVVGATVAEAVARRQQLEGTRMPDSWLQEVAENPSVSRQGLAFLAQRIEQKGFVSARDAVRWTEIEREVGQERVQAAERADGVSAPGARALLQRADRECGGLLGPGFLQRAKQSLPSIKEVVALTSEASSSASDLFSKATALFRRAEIKDKP